jgi:hypothetical protein
MATICVSNIYARSHLDIQARLHTLGIMIIQEASANFEIHYSGKLRIQSVSLTVRVCSDQNLIDFLQGKVSLEGILGPVTIVPPWFQQYVMYTKLDPVGSMLMGGEEFFMYPLSTDPKNCTPQY